MTVPRSQKPQAHLSIIDTAGVIPAPVHTRTTDANEGGVTAQKQTTEQETKKA